MAQPSPPSCSASGIGHVFHAKVPSGPTSPPFWCSQSLPLPSSTSSVFALPSCPRFLIPPVRKRVEVLFLEIQPPPKTRSPPFTNCSKWRRFFHRTLQTSFCTRFNRFLVYPSRNSLAMSGRVNGPEEAFKIFPFEFSFPSPMHESGPQQSCRLRLAASGYLFSEVSFSFR